MQKLPSVHSVFSGNVPKWVLSLSKNKDAEADLTQMCVGFSHTDFPGLFLKPRAMLTPVCSNLETSLAALGPFPLTSCPTSPYSFKLFTHTWRFAFCLFWFLGWGKALEITILQACYHFAAASPASSLLVFCVFVCFTKRSPLPQGAHVGIAESSTDTCHWVEC